METKNSIRHGKPAAYISTDVTYAMPSGSIFQIHLPMHNYTGEVNFKIEDSSGIELSIGDMTSTGAYLNIDTTNATEGTYSLVIISPGRYTNEDLQDGWVGNHLNRITINNALSGLEVTGDDGSSDIYQEIEDLKDIVYNKQYLEKGAEEQTSGTSFESHWTVDFNIPTAGTYMFEHGYEVALSGLTITSQIQLVLTPIDEGGTPTGLSETLFDNTGAVLVASTYEPKGSLFRRKTLLAQKYRIEFLVRRASGIAGTVYTKTRRLFISKLP